MPFGKITFVFLTLTVGSIPFEYFDIGGEISIVRIFFILTAFFALCSENLLPKRIFRIEKNLMLFILWSFITSLWSIDPAETLYKVLMLIQSLFIFFIITNLTTNEKRLKVLMIAWAIGSIAICLLTINDYRTSTVSSDDLYRVSLFGNPNENAFMLTYSVVFIMLADTNRYRIWSLLGMGIALYGIMAYGSRMGMLMFSISLIGFVISLWQTGKKRYSLILIPIVLFAGISIIQTLPDATMERLLNIGDDIQNKKMAGREDIWETAYDVLVKHPEYSVMGSGWGTFQQAMPLVKGRAYAAHNFYLDCLMTTGIVGLLIILYYLWSLYKLIRNTASHTILNYLMLLIPMMSMFSTNWSDRKWWFIMGALILSTQRIKRFNEIQ